jgi:hypothetical protein
MGIFYKEVGMKRIYEFLEKHEFTLELLMLIAFAAAFVHQVHRGEIAYACINALMVLWGAIELRRIHKRALVGE